MLTYCTAATLETERSKHISLSKTTRTRVDVLHFIDPVTGECVYSRSGRVDRVGTNMFD